MEESFREFPLEAINKVVSENTAILSNTLNSVIPKMVEISQIKKTLTVLNEYAKQIDWNAFYNEIKSNSSEMKEVLKRFDNNDANNVIKEMQEENRRGK